MSTAICPTCSDVSWVPGDSCMNCLDTPIEGRSYVLEGEVDCPTCDGDPDAYEDLECQHPSYVEWSD